MFGVGKPLLNQVMLASYHFCQARQEGPVETNLVNDLIPLLASNSNFDGLVHESRRNHDAMQLVRDTPSSLGDWRRHIVGLDDVMKAISSEVGEVVV